MRSENVMTILKENYLIRKCKDNIYNVYDKVEVGKCSNFNKYLCSVRVESKNVFEFELHPLFTELYGNNNIVLDNSNVVKSINNYLTTLEFNSEYFDPAWRYGYAEDRVLCDALKSLGLKDERSGMKHSFIFKGHRIEIDMFAIIVSETKRDTCVRLYNRYAKYEDDYSWREVSTDGSLKDTIQQVHNILFPNITIETIEYNSMFDKLEFSDYRDVVENTYKKLSIYSDDKLEDSISKLEQALEQLKSKRK